MQVNIENLIKIVQQHSVLYDFNSKDYYNRFMKRQLWENVCAELNSKWDTYDDGDKALYCKEVQKKWQSLRDSFRRELTAQKIGPGNGKIKTKYRYFDALQFLLPYTHSVQDSSSNETSFLIEQEFSTDSKDQLSEVNEPNRKRKYSSAFAEEDSNSKENQIEFKRRFADDDEAFLYSLLPSFKDYSLEQKYLLRIELMKTILAFKRSQINISFVKKECPDGEDDYS